MMQVTNEYRQHYCCSSLLSHCYRHAQVHIATCSQARQHAGDQTGCALAFASVKQDVLWHSLMSDACLAEQDLNQLLQTGFEKLRSPSGHCRWGQHAHSQGGAQLRVGLQLKKWLLLQPYPAGEMI